MMRLSICCVLFASCAVPAYAQERPRTAAEMLRATWGGGLGGAAAAANGPVKLATFPLRVEEIDHIRPLGMMASGHVTPSDHLYVVPKAPAAKGRRYDVLAVADGRLVMVQWRPKGNPDPTVFDREVDLKLIVEHAGTCWSYVDHLVALEASLAKRVGAELKPGRPVRVDVPVRAGQVIGHVERIFDFALVDAAAPPRTGFVVGERFLERDPWKPHTVDPFDYVDEPLRGRLLALNPRTAEPRGGRVDYDVDGKLVGNWYREKTGGYAGTDRRLDYWVGHLSIAYHYIDPAQVIVSIGDVGGRPRQFQVRGNGPEPAKVSAADGAVKYELIVPRISDQTGKPYADAPERYYGVLMVQVLEGRKLRVELFAGKEAGEVKAFTPAAATYER